MRGTPISTNCSTPNSGGPCRSPTREPGLVISYAYLWHHEHQAGREEGQKDRPSVIVLAVEREADGAIAVTGLPITHSAAG
jgi:hypothetical protein